MAMKFRLTAGSSLIAAVSCAGVSIWSTVVLAAVVILPGVAGCGPVRARPVDVDQARETLNVVLTHWQSGGTIEELKARRPTIIVQEPLWTSQNKLQEFRLVDQQGRPEDANWYCEVELTLGSSSGGVSKKKVTYVVGTDPVLTVFHAIL